MTEDDFLRAYQAEHYSNPLATVDAALFTYHDQQLKLLLVQRNQHPEKGRWGLPGGIIDPKQDLSLEASILRKLIEKTGIQPPYIEQLCSTGNANRDKRGWSISICYTALIAFQDCERHLNSVADVRWVSLDEVPETLAFDHASFVTQARERLRQKALYSLVPAYALPERFTLSELQQLHEVLLGKSIQKKSFRRRIEQAGILQETGEQRRDNGRPANLYRVLPEAAEFRFVRNLAS